MRNKTLLRVVQVLGFITSMALLPAAQALQITMTVPDCPSGQTLSFNPATNALACNGSVVVSNPVPSSCTLTATPSSSANAGLTANTQVQLSANCTVGDTPITYNWSIGVIGTGFTVAPSSTTTYTVTPSNANGAGAPFSTTVYIGNNNQQTTVAPSNCSVSQSPNTNNGAVAAGTTVNLSASCTGGSAVTGCSWSNNLGTSSCSVNVAPSATTSYSVTPSNSAGNGPTVGATVQITAVTNPNNNSTNYCTGSDQIITVNWPASGQVRPSTSGFGNNRIAFKITVPTTFSPALNINHTGFMRTAEVPGALNTFREITVSKNPCDFQSGNYLYNGMGTGDTGPSVGYTINNPTGYLQVGASFNANSGDVIYFNIRNVFNGAPSCSASSCDILFDFATPNRY